MATSGCGEREALRRCQDVRSALAKENASLRAREQAQKVLLARLQSEAASQPTSQAAVDVKLPGTPPKPLAEVRVLVGKQGKLSLDGKAVTLAELKAQLAVRYKANPSARVLVSADAGAHYKHVVDVFGAAKAVGYTRVGLVTR
ncbi:MAG: biopolymer transporter ExbD [Myxococcales bacterium]|nr:biopolymer transporter ExbD [Myxococcales bacterium]